MAADGGIEATAQESFAAAPPRLPALRPPLPHLALRPHQPALRLPDARSPRPLFSPHQHHPSHSQPRPILQQPCCGSGAQLGHSCTHPRPGPILQQPCCRSGATSWGSEAKWGPFCNPHCSCRDQWGGGQCQRPHPSGWVAGCRRPQWVGIGAHWRRAFFPARPLPRLSLSHQGP